MNKPSLPFVSLCENLALRVEPDKGTDFLRVRFLSTIQNKRPNGSAMRPLSSNPWLAVCLGLTLLAHSSGGEEPSAPDGPATATPVTSTPLRGVTDSLRELNSALGGWESVIGVPGLNLLKRSASTSRHLVLPTAAELDARSASEAEEVLLVLGRILEKAITRTELTDTGRTVSTAIRSVSGSPATRHLFLEGYGAVFSFNLNFSLAPSSSGTAQGTNASVSPAWAEARGELYGSRNREVRAVANHPASAETGDYEGRKVELVRSGVLEALKNATYLRQVKTNELVVVLLQGKEGGVVQGTRRTAEKLFSHVLPGSEEPNSAGLPTLCFRVRKSEADALARGQIDEEAFRKKVRVILY